MFFWTHHPSRLPHAPRALGAVLYLGLALACSPQSALHNQRTASDSGAEAGPESDDASASCRPPGASLFDGKTAELVNPALQPWWLLEKLCSLNTLMLFVGNGESMGTIEFRSALDASVKQEIERQFFDTQQRFIRSIERATSDLDKALEQNVCLSAFEQSFDAARAAGELPTLAQLQAVSYDEAKAARIRQIKERGKITLATIIDGPAAMDSKISTRSYAWRDVNGVATWQGESPVAWHWDRGSQKLQRANATAAPFELNLPRQVSSLIAQLTQLGPNGIPEQAHRTPVRDVVSTFDQILYTFKTHGGLFTQDSQQRPSLFERSLSDSAQSVLLFDTHGEQGEVLASDLYSPFWSKKNACVAYQTSGRNDLFAMEGCQKSSTHGSIAAGVAGIDSGYCSNTAGTGKSMLFDQSIVSLAEIKADGVLRLGEALIYDDDARANLPRGIGTFQIVAGSGKAEDSILLDSCFGSDRVSKALESSLQGWPKRLLTISNGNPLYFDLIQYGSLNATTYPLLPMLFVAGEDARQLLKKPLPANADVQMRTQYRDALAQITQRDSLYAHFTSGLETPLSEAEAPQQSYRQIIPHVLFLNVSQRDEP